MPKLGIGNSILSIQMRPHSSNSSVSLHPKAIEIASMLSTEIFRSPRSTEPIYVRCNPQRSANSSCEIPKRALAIRMLAENLCLADVAVIFLVFIMAKDCHLDDFKATDYK